MYSTKVVDRARLSDHVHKIYIINYYSHWEKKTISFSSHLRLYKYQTNACYLFSLFILFFLCYFANRTKRKIRTDRYRYMSYNLAFFLLFMMIAFLLVSTEHFDFLFHKFYLCMPVLPAYLPS